MKETKFKVVIKNGKDIFITPILDGTYQYEENEVSYEEFMQYIRLKDRNEKEVYAGIVIGCDLYKILQDTYGCYYISNTKEWSIEPHHCIVVENTFENPELLEGDK